jgi:hypothetical protein
MTVATGSNIGFGLNIKLTHIGVMEWYMVKVPEGHTAATWDRSVEVWFKIEKDHPFLGEGGRLCNGLVLVC